MDLFRHHHVRHLRGCVPQNLERYLESRPWAGKATGGGSVRLPSALEPAIPLDLIVPDGSDLRDLENTKIIYRAFQTLTPLQARDPRLWTRLTHIECWRYMRKRWDLSRINGDAAKKQRFVLTRYFVPQAQSRALLRNGLARLWWYGHLTHDSNRDDPFELTAVLLSFLDIAQQVLERNMGRAEALRTGFLDFIRTNDERLGNSSEQKRRRIRDLAKLLNLRGGFALLDSMNVEEIGSLLETDLSSLTS